MFNVVNVYVKDYDDLHKKFPNQWAVIYNPKDDNEFLVAGPFTL